ANREFGATHRPKIRIRRIFLLENLEAGKRPKICILAANIGATDATLVELGWGISTSTEYPPDASPSPLLQPMKIIPGKQAKIDVEGAEALGAMDLIAANDGFFYIVGVINYTDDQKNLRATSFARRYSETRRRFVVVADDHPESD